MYGRDALVHGLQLGQAQTFQPRLHALHATDRQRADLILVKIALRLDEDVEIAMVRRKFPEELVDVGHVNDVVDQSESGRVIAMGQVCHFLGDLVGRFGPKLHALRIEAAKRAMVLFPPPTTTRTFIQENAIEPLSRTA